VFNARTIPAQDLTLPGKFADRHKKLKGAGSDAHSATEVGRAIVILPDFDGKEGFLKAMAKARIDGHHHSPVIYIRSLARRIKKLFRRKA
jgi:hypothetical protein